MRRQNRKRTKSKAQVPDTVRTRALIPQESHVSEAELKSALELVRLTRPVPALPDEALTAKAAKLVVLASAFRNAKDRDKTRFLSIPESREFHAELLEHTSSLIEMIDRGFERRGLIVPLANTSLPPGAALPVADPTEIFSGDSEVVPTIQFLPPAARTIWLELADLRHRLLALRARCNQVDASNPLGLSRAELIAKPIEYEITKELSDIYEELTGRAGVTTAPEGGRGSGRFVDFVRAFYERFLPGFSVPEGTAIKSRRNELLEAGRLTKRRKITRKIAQ